MADETEVKTALKILEGARLRNAPTTEDEASKVLVTWVRVMQNVPGPALLQAVDDHIISGEFWPTVAEIRRQAANVKDHNMTSAAPDPFRPLIAGKEHVPYQVRTADGWEPWRPGRIELIQFPPEIQKKIDTIIERIGDGIMSDAQVEYIDKLTAPYKQGTA